MAEIKADLRQHNPELLDMVLDGPLAAAKRAAS